MNEDNNNSDDNEVIQFHDVCLLLSNLTHFLASNSYQKIEMSCTGQVSVNPRICGPGSNFPFE
jgi:hypothetical protein